MADGKWHRTVEASTWTTSHATTFNKVEPIEVLLLLLLPQHRDLETCMRDAYLHSTYRYYPIPQTCFRNDIQSVDRLERLWGGG
jgi:hypothetical protein